MRTKWVNAALLLVVVSLAGSGLLVLADDASAVDNDSGSRLFGENTGSNGVTATYLDGRLTISSSDFNIKDYITLEVDGDQVFENYPYSKGDDVWTGITLSEGSHTILVTYSDVKYDLFSLVVKQQYRITFTDGSRVYQEGWVDKDAKPVYSGMEPTKESTSQYTYEFSGWSPAITAATEPATYVAQFTETPILYDVKVNAGTGGTASASVTEAMAGTTVTLTANASQDYAFKEWTVVSGAVSITGNSFTMPASDVEITAVFESTLPDRYTVTLSASPSTGGTVTGAGTYDANSQVTITATANSGYSFNRWSNGSTDASITFVLTGDMSITAYFVADSPSPGPGPSPSTYRVTVETDGNGTASASPTSAKAGTTITLTATPKEGYVFKGWETTSGITITDNTFTMPSKNVTVKAVFEKPTVVVDVSFDRTTATLEAGSTMTITATVTPADAPDRSLVWSTSDESVVTVSGGVVTAVGPGTAKVTATTVSGKIATCTITVTMTDIVIEADDGQIPDSEISAIIDKVVPGQNVVLDAGSSDQIVVDVDSVLAILDKGAVVTIATTSGSVQVPSGSLVGVPQGQPMVINVTDVDVPEEHSAKVPEGSVIVDVTITVGDMVVTTFGTPITISIPVGEDVKDTSNLKVYHLADDGTMTDMDAIYDVATHSMVFQTGHLSVYAIVEEVPVPSDDKDNTLLYVAVVVVIVVVVALAAVMVMRKKN